MGIESVGWALRQKLPGTAKLVLIALCNHADDDTGHCWPSAELIARHASCSRRSVFTYLAALKRNGYIDIQSARRATGEQRSNNYWVLFDRTQTPWIFSGKTDAQDVDFDEGQDTEIAPSDDCIEERTQPDDGADSSHLALGQSATCCTPIEPSESEPSESSVTESVQRSSPSSAQGPQALAVKLARQAQQAKLQAADEARSKNKMEPVIQGTKAWELWVAHGHKPGLVTWVIVKGKQHRGWYFPSLFPPKSTGPPSSKSPLMTPQDEEELKDL